jgi:curved DNA-binding protein CbpA
MADDPFAVVGLAPTLDPRAVKRAYYAALQRHSPHSDPEGFQRLRGAYEALLAPGGLQTAFLASPPDMDQELERLEARFGDQIAHARSARQGELSVAARARRFREFVSWTSWPEISRLISEEPG